MMPVVESLPALVVVLLLLDKMYYSWCFAGECGECIAGSTLNGEGCEAQLDKPFAELNTGYVCADDSCKSQLGCLAYCNKNSYLFSPSPGCGPSLGPGVSVSANANVASKKLNAMIYPVKIW